MCVSVCVYISVFGMNVFAFACGVCVCVCVCVWACKGLHPFCVFNHLTGDVRQVGTWTI